MLLPAPSFRILLSFDSGSICDVAITTPPGASTPTSSHSSCTYTCTRASQVAQW